MSVALENARLFDETQRLLKETEQRTPNWPSSTACKQASPRNWICTIYESVGDKIRDIFDAQVEDIVHSIPPRTPDFPYSGTQESDLMSETILGFNPLSRMSH